MSSVFVKYCPACGRENPRLQPLCLDCNADLTMVQAMLKQDEETAAPAAAPPAVPAHTMLIEEPCAGCTLELVADPNVTFAVADGQTVGRTGDADVALAERVPDWQYISSRHALFTRRGEQWYVRHVGSTNYIMVDGAKYAEDVDVAVYDNTALVLSKTAFRVRISGAPTE